MHFDFEMKGEIIGRWLDGAVYGIQRRLGLVKPYVAPPRPPEWEGKTTDEIMLMEYSRPNPMIDWMRAFEGEVMDTPSNAATPLITRIKRFRASVDDGTTPPLAPHD